MMRRPESTRDLGFRRALIAGAFGAIAFGMTAVPTLADTVYYYDAPPATEQTTTTTTTYTNTEPSRTYVYERERDHDRHGAGIHLDTPILNFGIGVH